MIPSLSLYKLLRKDIPGSRQPSCRKALGEKRAPLEEGTMFHLTLNLDSRSSTRLQHTHLYIFKSCIISVKLPARAVVLVHESGKRER
jgi:hypothetical protein